VGDIKPMEYPITFWMDMAWNPRRFNPDNLYEHTLNFCREQFGEGPAPEAARILTMYSKYNARVTPELLNENTYSLKNYHEFQRVTDEYKELEKAAQSQYNQLAPEYRDAYDELVRFPVMACANLYEMYYAVAMNKELAAHKDTLANQWADKAEACFQRDADLTKYYNREIAHGKWNHMMDQVHIGYTSWNEPRRNVMPQVIRVIP
jgi:hypothetical protein